METKVICPQMPAEQILNRYGTQMLRFCTACLQSEAAGEEAMVRAFGELCRGTPKAPGSSQERVWVLTALLKACKDRETGRQPEQQDGLLKNLAALSLGQRKLFLMRYYWDAGEEEIAQVLHLPKSFVHCRLAKALKQLENEKTGPV